MKFVALCLGLFLCLSLVVTQGHAANVLKTVTFSARESVWMKNFELFVDGVRKESDIGVRFQYVGGPEAIPPFEQIEALRRGIVDVALIPGAYFVPQLPEADGMKLSRFLPEEERENGVYDFYRKLMGEKLSVVYLGRLTGGTAYHFYLKRAISKPSFAGLKIRVTPIYEPFVKALGGIPVTMAPGEVYIALGRGVVDGFGWPSIGVSDLGWQEVISYRIEPGFYQTDVCVLVNLDSWNRLDEKTRQRLTDAMKTAERESVRLSREMADKEVEFLSSKGVKTIWFEGKDEKQYLDLAYRVAWDKLLSRSPEYGKTLKKLLEK